MSDFANQYFPRLQQQVDAAGNNPGAYLAAFKNGTGDCYGDPFCGAAQVLGDLYYGAPLSEAAKDLTFQVGMTIFYKSEAEIAYQIENPEAYQHYQTLYQNYYAMLSQNFGAMGVEAVAKLEGATDVQDLINTILDLNASIQTSAYETQPGCGPRTLNA